MGQGLWLEGHLRWVSCPPCGREPSCPCPTPEPTCFPGGLGGVVLGQQVGLPEACSVTQVPLSSGPSSPARNSRYDSSTKGNC